MGRITVSLPDELETVLDAYAAEHNLPVSQVVARALEAFLDPAAPPPPEGDLHAVQRYLDQVVARIDGIRNSLHQMAVAQYGPFADIPESVTQPLPGAPWKPSGGRGPLG